jgi:hypothetical protein
MTTETHRKYLAEIERLDGEIAHYDRQWTKVPQFGWAALLVPVAGVVSGWGAAIVALLVTLALVGVRAYLIAMRKSENMWTRDRLLAEIDATEPSFSLSRQGEVLACVK